MNTKHHKIHNKLCRPLKALLFLQCPAPAWPDCGHGRPPAPASRPWMALGAAHTPTSCSVAEHTHAAPRRSAGARTPTSPWRVFLIATWTRSSQSPLKWPARVHSAPYPTHFKSNYTSLYLHYIHLYSCSTYHALSSALSLADNQHTSIWLLYPLCLSLFLDQFNHPFLHLFLGISNNSNLSLLLSVAVFQIHPCAAFM